MSFNPDTLGRLLLQRAAVQSNDEALVFPEDRLTFREIEGRATDLARALIGLGVERGDRVALLMPNCVDMVSAIFATSLTGAVMVPINARYKRRELSHVIGHSGAIMILTTDLVADHVDFLNLILDSLPGLSMSNSGEVSVANAPALRHLAVFGTTRHPGIMGSLSLENAAERVTAEQVLDRQKGVGLSDDAIIMYTSGTTQLPKGCVLTNEAVTRDSAAYASRMGLEQGGRIWAPCPMFHMAGLGPLTAAVGVGATTVSVTHFTPDVGLRQLRQEQLTHLHGAFPQITAEVLRHPDLQPDDVSTVGVVMNVASPELQRELQDLLPPGARLVSIFGMTEGSGPITMTTAEDPPEAVATTCGKPLEGVEVRLVDPDTDQVLTTPGQPGEIQFRGFNSFTRYHDDPERTAETILQGGWVRTGDLGRLDDAGRLSYDGRLKDMLKVGGENAAPLEIESHLEGHAAVKLAQVVGRPDDRYGEVPVAFVELQAGAESTAEELIDHCIGQLASFKVPREIRFVLEWPMSATKIQKYRLREELLSAGQPTSIRQVEVSERFGCRG